MERKIFSSFFICIGLFLLGKSFFTVPTLQLASEALGRNTTTNEGLSLYTNVAFGVLFCVVGTLIFLDNDDKS